MPWLRRKVMVLTGSRIPEYTYHYNSAVFSHSARIASRPPMSIPSPLTGSNENPLCADRNRRPAVCTRRMSSVDVYRRSEADFSPLPPGPHQNQREHTRPEIESNIDSFAIRVPSDNRLAEGAPRDRKAATISRCAVSRSTSPPGQTADPVFGAWPNRPVRYHTLGMRRR